MERRRERQWLISDSLYPFENGNVAHHELTAAPRSRGKGCPGRSPRPWNSSCAIWSECHGTRAPKVFRYAPSWLPSLSRSPVPPTFPPRFRHASTPAQIHPAALNTHIPLHPAPLLPTAELRDCFKISSGFTHGKESGAGAQPTAAQRKLKRARHSRIWHPVRSSQWPVSPLVRIRVIIIR